MLKLIPLTVFVLMSLLVMNPSAFAEYYTVCYLPPDNVNKTLRFCAADRGATLGDMCACSAEAGGTGNISTIEVPPEDQEGTTGEKTTCLLQSSNKRKVTLCRRFHSSDNTTCQCDRSAELAGKIYSVEMVSTFAFRSNPVAQADFLKRLKECCVSK